MHVCVSLFVYMCVQLHRGSQIGPQKTPSDVSGQCSPMACVCVWPHASCVWAIGALVLYGTMVIRTTGETPDRQGVHVCVCMWMCLWHPPFIWPCTVGPVMSLTPSLNRHRNTHTHSYYPQVRMTRKDGLFVCLWWTYTWPYLNVISALLVSHCSLAFCFYYSFTS